MRIGPCFISEVRRLPGAGIVFSAANRGARRFLARRPVFGLLLLGALGATPGSAPAGDPASAEAPPGVRELDRRIAELSGRLEEQARAADRLAAELEAGRAEFERKSKRMKELEKEWEEIRAGMDAHLKTAEALRKLLQEREKGLQALLEWQRLKRDMLSTMSAEGPSPKP